MGGSFHYRWIFCSAHPSRWQDMSQYKLLILKTSHQFPGKEWLHYDSALRVNLDLYNFYTCLAPPSKPLVTSSPSSVSDNLSSNFCRLWNDGTCRWPFGQCQYHHCCEKCEWDHPRDNRPFLASRSSIQRSHSTTSSPIKCQWR